VKAVIHFPNEDQIKRLYKDLDEFRLDMALKHVENMGFSDSALNSLTQEIKKQLGQLKENENKIKKAAG